MVQLTKKKIKYLFDYIIKGKNPIYSEEETPYIVFGQRNNSKKGMTFEECKYTNEFFYTHREEREFLKYGDILINSLGGGTCGRIGYFNVESEIPILTDGIPYILRNKKTNKYLYYVLLSRQKDIEYLALGATNQVSLKDLDLNNFVLEIIADGILQNRITDFLDIQCNKIDGLMSDVQSQIETLEEYKKSVISEAVTKGLNPNEELKQTGFQYWNKIPVNWELVDIKYLFEIVKRIAGKEGYDILSVTQKGLKIKDISNNEGQIADSYAGYQFVYPTDFVMNHMDLLTGWVDCSTMFGVTSPDYRVFRQRNKSNNNSYYKYVLQSCYFNKTFYSLGNGVSTLGRWRLQTESFNNFLFPVPPIEEQKQIADYLDCKCADIESVISDKKSELEILEEYKKSLIYEYVTGKKEVPNE